MPDESLMTALRLGDAPDLAILVDVVTDRGEGRFALSEVSRKTLVTAQERGMFDDKALEVLAAEIQAYGGNSVMNLFRGGGASWSDIVQDVARRVGVKFARSDAAEDVELAILAKIAQKAFESMSAAERSRFFDEFGIPSRTGLGEGLYAALILAIRASGFRAYQVAAIVAHAVAKAVLGRGLTFGATAGLMRGLSVFTGPVGWAVTGLWTALDLASPAYRITLPCVVQVAYIRQKGLHAGAHRAASASSASACPGCGRTLGENDNFCPGCGRARATA